MKKNLSMAGFGLVTMGLLMGSCVSKRKYMEAQTSASERYRTDSAQWADRSNTMQQNMTSLEQKSTNYQKQMDSFKTSSMNYQKRWDNFQSTYTQQSSSVQQLHEQIHTAIDQYVEASNVESRNGKVYVNLPENMLFTSSGSTLSAKGKQALDKLATVLAASENFEVDIVTSAAYYNNAGTANSDAEMNNSSDMNNSTMKKNHNNNVNPNATTNDNNATNRNADDNAKAQESTEDKTTQSTAQANIGDSAYPGSGSVTKGKMKQDPAKNKAAAKSKATQKSNTAGTAKNNQGDRSMSFKSKPKAMKTKATASKAPSWNLNVARSTAIVRQLTQNGLPQARIVIAGQNGKGTTTNEWASTNRGYQIVLTPKMDSYYQMMQEGQGTTSMK